MMQMMIITNLSKHLKLYMMNVFHLRNVLLTRKKNHYRLGSPKGCLQVLIRKINCIKSILGIRPMENYKSLKHIKQVKHANTQIKAKAFLYEI